MALREIAVHFTFPWNTQDRATMLQHFLVFSQQLNSPSEKFPVVVCEQA